MKTKPVKLSLTSEQIQDLRNALRAGARYAFGHSEISQKEGKPWAASDAQSEACRILRAHSLLSDVSL